jgi:TRAP-type C4-dicarboxylate transport system permease small subunit
MSITAISQPLKKILAVMEKIYTGIGVALLGVILLINAMEIFSRTILDYSFYWIQEFTVVGCGYVIFLGAVVLFMGKGDILISALYNRMPPTVQRVLTLVNDLVMLIFLMVAIKSSLSYVSFIYGGYSQTMKLPMYIIYLPILICFITLFLVVLDWLLGDMAKLCSQRTGNGSD